jgi:hypothetical protein
MEKRSGSLTQILFVELESEIGWLTMIGPGCGLWTNRFAGKQLFF